MTNWEARDLTLDLSFLEEGHYQAIVFKDGVNADREATDYKKEVIAVTAGDRLEIHLSNGGGWAAASWSRRSQSTEFGMRSTRKAFSSGALSWRSRSIAELTATTASACDSSRRLNARFRRM